MDNPVEPPSSGDYDRLAERVSRVEGEVHDTHQTLIELKMMVARIEAQLPYLATKAEIANLEVKLADKLADKPGKTYMWGILGALLTAYACGLAALAILK